MKNNLDTPVAKQCRALYTKYRTRTYVRPIKSGPQIAFRLVIIIHANK